MAKQRIGRTLIVLDEKEVQQILRLQGHNDPAIIYAFIKQVIYQRVEAALRKRCG
jgi:hypothetical protein